MLKGFKDFILRGNLVELAVAFIMAAAFAVVVTATVALLMDIIGKIGGDPGLQQLRTRRRQRRCLAHRGDLVRHPGGRRLLRHRDALPKARERDGPRQGRRARCASPEDVALLTEIRDLLAQRNASASTAGSESQLTVMRRYVAEDLVVAAPRLVATAASSEVVLGQHVAEDLVEVAAASVAARPPPGAAPRPRGELAARLVTSRRGSSRCGSSAQRSATTRRTRGAAASSRWPRGSGPTRRGVNGSAAPAAHRRP